MQVKIEQNNTKHHVLEEEQEIHHISSIDIEIAPYELPKIILGIFGIQCLFEGDIIYNGDIHKIKVVCDIDKLAHPMVLLDGEVIEKCRIEIRPGKTPKLYIQT